MNEFKEKICYLKDIYQQQHYFIDRHDTMAERFINILLVEITALTIIFSLVANITTYTVIKAISIIIYITFFSVTLIKLFLVIRPLSAIAKDKDNEELLRNENKKWVDSSLVYYQGINAHRKKATEQEESPSETYVSNLKDEIILKDLTQQIFILAQYSEYKSKQIRNSVKWVIGTTVLGIVTIILLIVL